MTSIDKKVTFAIAGASNIAETHITNIQKCDSAQIKYIFSQDEIRAERFTSRYNIEAINNFAKVLEDSDIDAVVIATEPMRHASLAIEAIQHGKHVLIEKPLDSNIQMAKDVLEEANNSSVVTSVVSQNRFDPKFIEMKNKLDRGLIGEPFLCETRMHWNRSLDYYSSGNGWRGKIGNVLLNQGIHLIDIVMWFFGYPKHIDATLYKVNEYIECYDNAILTFEFNDNFRANMIFSTTCRSSEPFGFRIYGTKGTLIYGAKRNYSRSNQTNRVADQLKTYFGNRSFLTRGKSLFQLQMEDFIYSIINKTDPVVSIKEAYEVLSVVKKCEAISCFPFSNY